MVQCSSYCFLIVGLFLVHCKVSDGFSPMSSHSPRWKQRTLSPVIKKNMHVVSSVSVERREDVDRHILLNPFYKALASPVSLGPHLAINGKIINLWGILYSLVIAAVAAVVLPLMAVAAFISDAAGNGARRRSLDWIVHFWAKISLWLSCGNQTILYGRENLPAHGEAVMYVPNHTTYFDILLLSGFVPRPFKYLAKSEILDIPLVGWGMRLAKHIFLRRNDPRSIFECDAAVVKRLQDGNSMVVFPEGTRSSDGTLKPFRKGAFKMAKEAGCKVVPVSIGNLHRWMPLNSLMPLGPIRHTYIKIHPAIDGTGMKVAELKNKCFEAVNSGLPPYQQFKE